eukprot:158753-Amphidinium_carterae.1
MKSVQYPRESRQKQVQGASSVSVVVYAKIEIVPLHNLNDLGLLKRMHNMVKPAWALPMKQILAPPWVGATQLLSTFWTVQYSTITIRARILTLKLLVFESSASKTEFSFLLDCTRCHTLSSSTDTHARMLSAPTLGVSLERAACQHSHYMRRSRRVLRTHMAQSSTSEKTIPTTNTIQNKLKS